MSAHSSSESNNDQAALAKYARELDIPAPFDLETFGRWLERHCGHPVRLIPASMEPGAPSGLFVRRTEADYLYYEQRTSPFHQSHIVLCLAARVLLGEGEVTCLSIDPQLVPDVSPQLARLMFGRLTGGTTAPHRAEAFAFMVLNHARPAVLTRQCLQQLRPLHDALCGIVPHAPGFAISGSGFQLHRQIIEICDAMLALRPYRNPQLASGAMTAFQAAGIAGDDLQAAAVEASALAAALKAKAANEPPRHAGDDDSWQPVASSSLASEAAWLIKVSEAFAQIPG